MKSLVNVAEKGKRRDDPYVKEVYLRGKRGREGGLETSLQ